MFQLTTKIKGSCISGKLSPDPKLSSDTVARERGHSKEGGREKGSKGAADHVSIFEPARPPPTTHETLSILSQVPGEQAGPSAIFLLFRFVFVVACSIYSVVCFFLLYVFVFSLLFLFMFSRLVIS